MVQGISDFQKFQTGYQAAFAQPVQVETGAIVGESQNDFVTFLRQIQRYLANLRLALGQANRGVFEPMRDGVAQHVFKRRQHLLEHGSVKFDLGTMDFKVRPLADFFGSLPNDMVETIDDAAEWHHAYGH